MPHNESIRSILRGLPEDQQEAADAMHALMAGNQRFVQGALENVATPSCTDRRLEFREYQAPHAVVICCSDSRCPPELVFDQSLGQLFIIRVAGNIVNQHILGSISYALSHLGTKLVVVLGHTKCGAVKASVADFVDSTTKQLKEREEEEERAAAERMQKSSEMTKKKESKFLSRLLSMFGSKDERAVLVRTASFRDAEHAAHPINSIVLSIAPAVKDVVWALLQEQGAAAVYAPGTAAGSTFPQQGVNGGAHRSSSEGSSSGHYAAAYEQGEQAEAEEEGGTLRDRIMTDLMKNSMAWVQQHDSDSDEGDSGGEGWGGDGGMQSGDDIAGAGGAAAGHGLEEPHSLVPLRWDCEALQGATVQPGIEVCENLLHKTLAESSESICLHTAMRCNKFVNSCTYQNVRRQGGEIWEAMLAWVEPSIMAHVVMSTAVYDIDRGIVEFFGLQSLDSHGVRRAKSRLSMGARP